MRAFSFFFLFLSFFSLSSPAFAQQLLIEWSNTAKLSNGSSTLEKLGGQRLGSLQTPLMRKKGRGIIERVSLPKGANIQEAVDSYKGVPGVVNVEENQKFKALETSNDTLYVNGSLWGMYSSDSPTSGPSGTTNTFGSQAEQAWRQDYIGSMSTVVGIVDTGIDYTHPDLYLNIYLNPGEIKTLPFFNSLVDTDGDGNITFRDLNNSANSSRVSDLNSNGRIDAGDLLADSRWSNGVDNDNNGYVDDLVGWDFVNNDNDPMDDNEHGTHVAGTVAGIGGNSAGVVGVNWKAQVVALKFLDAGGGGYLSDALSAIDYYTALTQAQDKSFDSNSSLVFIGTNNSWGGGGFSSFLQTAINNGALVNNHFVAAAGNDSSNNNSYPAYPANYSTVSAAGWEAVTSVASLNSNGTLSSFSNYGSTTVDLGAPGAGVQSSIPGTGYAAFSGTSMATPHVAGALALYISSFPEATRREIREVLLSTSTATPSLNGKAVTNGRLNIQAGVAELKTRYPGNSPTYTISGPMGINEGNSLTLSVTTSNVQDGTTLYWSIAGVQVSDISPASLTGSLNVANNTGSLTLSILNDNLLEGNETLSFALFTDPSRTTQVGSFSITVSDTSTGYSQFWGTTRNDRITGNSAANAITGVPSTGVTTAALGRNQVDTVAGGAGGDVFVLGQTREGSPRIFYNNGVVSTIGSTDYLQITDFNKNQDKLLFTTGRYFSRTTGSNTTIYWDRNNNGSLQITGSNRDEVIAVLRNVNLGNATITSTSRPSWALVLP